MSAAEGTDVRSADYSEAGLRLGFVAEREVVQPLFDDLYAFLLNQGDTELGGIQLGPGRKYTLGMAAPLLADQWPSMRSQALKSTRYPGDNQAYFTAQAKQPLNRRDRALLDEFLEQWEHPMGQWFSNHPEAVASTLDQISKLRNLAAHATTPLYQWTFTRMRDLVVGSKEQRSLLRQIYEH